MAEDLRDSDVHRPCSPAATPVKGLAKAQHEVKRCL